MSNELHILMTADTVGGVWTYVLELIRALQPHEVTVTLATMGPPPSTLQRREIAAFAQATLHESKFALEWMDAPWRGVDAAGEWLLELSASVQPDVIHLNGYAHAALPWEAPVVIVAHSCVLSWWQAVKGNAAPAACAEYQQRVECGLQAAELVVAPTTAMLAALREHYEFHGNACVVSNGRSAGYFQPRTKESVIFTAGRLWDEAKNLALLQRLAPDLQWPVHVAGNLSQTPGSKFCATANISQGSGLMALGHLSSGELAEHLGRAAIYAAPARYEPFGLGILEAALSGCALVLADLPSLRENWSGAAKFVPPDDEPAWLEALNALSGAHAERGLLSMRAIERAHHFSPAAMGRKYLNIYHELSRRGLNQNREVAFA